MSRSLISVIIPNYNCARWISKTLDSCLAQKEFLKEIIVVDDFSTDNSWELLTGYEERYPELIKMIKNRNKGGNNARNLGYEASSGEYIQWLDADDQIMEGKFRSQLQPLESDSSVDIVYSDWKLTIYNGDRMLREEKKLNRPYSDWLYELLVNNWSTPHCYLVRRSLAERLHTLKAWNPETTVMQDKEYFTLAASLGVKAVYVPGCFANYNRWNRNSVSAAKKELRYLNFEKILDRVEGVLHTQSWIPPPDLIKYQDIINTEKLLIRVAGFPSAIHYGTIRLSHVKWKIVKGIRTHLKLVLRVLRHGS